MQINGHFLINNGIPTGPGFSQILQEAKKMESVGMDIADIKAYVLAQKPEPVTLLHKRDKPLELQEAIRSTSPEEVDNLEKVRQKMQELTVVPIIERASVMPDACPAGSEEGTIPVGGAIVTKNAIIPASHSADICCSMYCTFFESPKEVGTLMDSLQAVTRFGAGGRRDHELVQHPVNDEDVWDNKFLKGLRSYAERHMADQGDGNHFAYIGECNITEYFLKTCEAAGHAELAKKLQGQTKVLSLVTHHGSRGLGAQLYKRGLDAAVKYTKSVAHDIPKAGAWLDYSTLEGQEYWEALQYISRWTKANHEAIHSLFLNKSGSKPIVAFGNEHNFVWTKETPDPSKINYFYHGKGATPAWMEGSKRKLGLIPLNMASPILIVVGNNNTKYLSFAPHGAGRNLSRTALTKDFRDDQGELQTTKVKKAIETSTKGLDIRWYCGRPDISESPIGYKNAENIIAQINEFGLAEVVAEIQPLGCIMAGDQPKFWEKAKRSKKSVRQEQHRASRRNTKAELKQHFG